MNSDSFSGSLDIEMIHSFAKFRDDVVFVEGGREISYGELDQLLRVAISNIRRLNLPNGGRIGLVLPRGLDFAVIALALFLEGLPFVPIDPEYPDGLMEKLIAKLDPQLLIGENELIGRKGAILTSDLFVKSGQDIPLAAKSFREDEIAIILLTSGSTGIPQAVPRTHGCLTATMSQALNIYRPGGKQATSLMRSPTGSSGIVWELFYPVTAGGKVIIATPSEARSPARLASLIWKHEIVSVDFTPAGLEGVVMQKKFQESQFIRRIGSSGAKMPDQLLKLVLKHFRERLALTYGCTEAPGIATRYPGRDGTDARENIGKVNPSYGYKVIDEKGESVKQGDAGILAVTGPRVAPGYLGNDELTRKRFQTDRESGKYYFLTGDLVKENPDNTISLLGRSDRVVQIRGFRVNLCAIEDTIRKVKEVRRVAVVKDENSEIDLIHAFIELGTSDQKVMRSVRDEVRNNLPSHSYPAKLILLDQLPQTITGKIEYASLPKASKSRQDWEIPAAPPETELEEKFIKIWQRLLKISPIGVHDDFFLSGGDSLLVIQFMESCDRELGIKVRYEDVYQYPVLRFLARHLDQGSGNPTTPLLTVANKDGKGCPIVSVCSLRADLDVWRKGGGDHPIFAFEYTGANLSGEPSNWQSVEEIAANLNEILLKRTEAKSFRFAAYCRGTVIAHEMAKQLIASGYQLEKMVFNELSHIFRRQRSGGHEGGENPGERREANRRRSLPELFKKHGRNLSDLKFRGRINYIRERLRFGAFASTLCKRIETSVRIKIGMDIPTRLDYYYLINFVYKPVFLNYEPSPVSCDVDVFYNEFGGYHQGQNYKRLTTSGLSVEKLEGAGHGDSLRSPYLERWLSPILD